VHTHDKPKVLLVGLGAVGRAVGSRLAAGSLAEVVGAVDLAPALAGADLDTIIPGANAGARISSSLAEAPDADVAFVATTSFVAQVEPMINELLDRGMNVVSICEQLGFGFYDHDVIARRLDEHARRAGLTVLGTGCNPGILLDTLPLLLSSLTLDVTRVTIRRTAEMSGYGGILSKFGFGLTAGQFLEQRDAGNVIGHVGFRESVAALADGLGWALDEIVVDDPEAILFTDHERTTLHLTIEAGTIVALRHAARGIVDGRVVIDAKIDFGLFEAADGFPDGDSWTIESDIQTLGFSSSRIDSAGSTVAVAANVIPSLPGAQPGLLTMADLPPKKVAAKARTARLVAS
jgi:4-hydroxy-tetrahydrodipicolinate reductase